jgi:hypothetical protein
MSNSTAPHDAQPRQACLNTVCEIPVAISAELLNAHCACVTLDRAQLDAALAREFDGAFSADTATKPSDVDTRFDTPETPPLDALHSALVDVERAANAALANARPHLFSSTTVFISSEQAKQMAQFVAAHQRIVALAGWQAAALADAPEVSRQPSLAEGVLMGYDFHMTEGGAQLIEINTNAGGALLNMILARAQLRCCGVPDVTFSQAADDAKILQMFLLEWRACKGEAALRHIAIVDSAPLAQYLLPEFLLFQRLFERAGIRASICDPADLQIVNGTLQLDGNVIDLVYNRSTDFAFADAKSASLRQAWLAALAVITPNPRAHALFADKRLLIRLSDIAFLESIGVAPNDIASCKARVPLTQLVQPEQSEGWWRTRSAWFFKPADGFGGKATYRGDKLTRRVFDEILRSNYVGQQIVAPSLRVQNISGSNVLLKSDLRAYSYAGKVLLYAARLYQGQTTNFRTPGGGFAAVLELPAQA